MNIKGAIFDLDGTLLDSMPYWENLGYEYLIREGYSPWEDLNEALKTMSALPSLPGISGNSIRFPKASRKS